MKLLFTGDINFRGKENLTFEESEKILSEVLPIANNVDYVIPNLECPLADKEKHTPIKKSGPHHIYSAENICFLKALRADAVTIANNHIGDFGEEGIKDTLKLLDDNQISHCGVGENLSDAYRAYRTKKGFASVSVISVCENEFGIATETKYGSAGYNPRRLLHQIKVEKSVSDYVIVVFHGGNEFNPLPSPDTVDRYRLICDMGADAVIGGHTHCPQGYEIYDNKPIIYSMGNFLFKSGTERAENDSWHYGYMTILNIQEGITIEIVPYKFDVNATKIKVFDGCEKLKFMDYLKYICDIIQDSEELDKYFAGWAWNHKWCPIPPKDFENLGTYNPAGHYNLVKCEAHLSQLQKIYSILHFNQTEIAKHYSHKVQKLQYMPF